MSRLPTIEARSETASELHTEIEAHYDAVPYPNGAYSQTHPDYLATLATLLGLEPAPVERCRVLEIGCAGGSNLLPMAWGLPGSMFVGLDLSARQVREGQANIEALGLKNIQLRQMNILEVDTELGEFDYIIAHGIYSWVPHDVRDRLLAICKQNLAPNGVAYVSYNVFPGWHALSAIREMAIYHTRRSADPKERVEQARQLLRFLTSAAENTEMTYVRQAYVTFMRHELERIENRTDNAFLHDELEPVNDPVYFYQFVEHAARHGLQFLNEAQFAPLKTERISEQVQEKLDSISQDVVEQEQYHDFLNNATFRRTLLCHDHIAVERNVPPERLKRFYLASAAQPVSREPDLQSNAVEKFFGRDESSISTNHPLSKGAIVYLTQMWPRAVPYETVFREAWARVANNDTGADIHNAPTEDDVRMMGATLARSLTYSERLVSLHVHAPSVAPRGTERPRVSKLALLEASHGDTVTNAYHQTARLDNLTKYLLPYMDGTRDKTALTELLLAGPVAEGKMQVLRDDAPVEEDTDVAGLLENAVAQRIEWLADKALLVA